MSDKLKSLAIALRGLSEEEIDALLAQASGGKARDAARVAYEHKRDQTVFELCDGAADLQRLMSKFKQKAFELCDDHYEGLKKYGHIQDSNRGTFTLVNTSQTQKVEVQMHRSGSFDERAEIAAKKVLSYLDRRITDAEIRELVVGLLEQKNGQFDPKNISKLYQYEDRFDDTEYTEAMQLFREAYRLDQSARYVRFYERAEPGDMWSSITLNFAKL